MFIVNSHLGLTMYYVTLELAPFSSFSLVVARTDGRCPLIVDLTHTLISEMVILIGW